MKEMKSSQKDVNICGNFVYDKVTTQFSGAKGNASRFPFSSLLSFQCGSPNTVRLFDIV